MCVKNIFLISENWFHMGVNNNFSYCFALGHKSKSNIHLLINRYLFSTLISLYRVAILILEEIVKYSQQAYGTSIRL